MIGGMNSNTRIAQKVLDKQGYLVIASHQVEHSVGDVINESIDGVPGPFAVVGIATAEEYMNQPFITPDLIVRNRKDAARAVGFYRLAAE